MSRKSTFLHALSAVALLASTTLPAAAAGSATAPSPKPAAAQPALADFAGGCFWCMETQFEGLPGVLSVTSGYAGGHKDHPSYEEVGTGTTGHMESVEVRYDPSRIGYTQLLNVFWHSIDPTQGDGQFCDIGNEYRSAIFVRDETQRKLALESKRRLEASGVLKAPIATPILTAGTFWPAEDYHQDFYKKDPQRYHSYREGCGRDRRLAQLWGKDAARPSVH